MAHHTALNSMLSSEGLDTLPDWPTNLASRLTEVADGIFATDPVPVSPWDLGHWQSILADLPGDFALCGFAGYGIQSMGFHLFLKRGPLILMIQTAWGGYAPDEDQAESASGAVGLANDIIDLAERVQSTGRWPDRQFLWVIDSDFRDSGCVWTEGSAPPADIASGESVLGALNKLEALLASEQPS